MPKLSSVLPLLRAGFVLAREGVVSALPAEALPPPVRFAHTIAGWIARRRAAGARSSQRLTVAVNRLGPSWVKLGQFLATRPDIVGREMAGELELLQDRMAPFATDAARTAVEQSLGRPVDEVFGSFSEPIAAASIAQVHRAVRRRDGATVAVKVIRPGIRDQFHRDLQTFFSAAQLLEQWVPATHRLRPVAVVEMLQRSARIEMDLRLEAAALAELGANTASDPGFRVPAPDWELTGRDCLTLEWAEGVRPSDRETLIAAGHDPVRIAAALVQNFLRHTLRDGFFHADMHPGNLFIDKAGDIVAVDLGIMGRLGRKEQRFLAEILHGFIIGDYRRVARVHLEAGYVPRTHSEESFAQAIRAIGEPIHGQPADTISMAKLLTLLFEVTELFDMQTRPELLLLQKTMVVVEGVARRLDPEFNMWKTAAPVVSEWLPRHVGPAAIVGDAAEAVSAARSLLRQLPELARRAEKLAGRMEGMAENGLSLDEETLRKLAAEQARRNRSGRWALWVIALISFLLWTGL